MEILEMLRTFLYLNLTYLDDYMGQLEGGIASQLTEQEEHSTSGGLGADVHVVRGNATKGVTSTSIVRRSDNPAAQFDRLDLMASERPDDVWWTEVLNPDDDLSGLFGMLCGWVWGC
jgi:hypothetical protein